MATRSRAWAALALVASGGCWIGSDFYSAAEVQAPIAPGIYRTARAGSPADHGAYRVSVRDDGYTLLKRLDGQDEGVAGFAPLPGRDGTFVAWFQESGPRKWEPGSMPYGLIERSGREFVISFPVCSETRLLAEAAGAVFLPDKKVPLCRFADRSSLEAGLRRIAADGPVESLRLIPSEEETGRR